MAAAPTVSQIFQNHTNNNNSDTNINNIHEVRREDIQAAIAKAVELRALHAALMQQGNSPANITYPSASPASHPVSHLSAQDYPVFTPVSFHLFTKLFHFYVFLYNLTNWAYVIINRNEISSFLFFFIF